MTITMTMWTQGGCCWRRQGTVETLGTLGQELRPSRMSPKGRSCEWRGEEPGAKKPGAKYHSLTEVWWYQGWRAKRTHYLTLPVGGYRGYHRHRSCGECALDQGLAMDSLEDNATGLMLVSYLELKIGVLEIIKTRNFFKERFAGKITSRAAECIDKI